MNKTTAFLVAIIVVLVGSFAWYAAKHPDRGYDSRDSVGSGDDERHPSPRVLNLDLAAAGLDGLDLDVGVGEVHVTASPDDQVHAKVTLKSKQHDFFGLHWTSSSSRQIAAAAIKQERQDKRLVLSLDYPHDQDDIKQEWEVQLPARLALGADMKVGEMTIACVAGGVEAKLDVGELSIDTPMGRIHGEVNVGEVRATSGSDKHGHIELSSNIGEAVLVLAGESIGKHEHGGLGNHVSLDGSGPDEMRLSVNVGEVSLHIESGAPKKED
jgi:hypothetical protein